MQIYIFFAGMLTAFLLIGLMKKTLILNSFNFSEKQLLLISMSLLQYKYHAIEIIEIVYDKASEDDPKYLKEKQEVINKINEKFNSFGDQWIINLKKILPYETEYNSWKEAIEYAEKLFSKSK